MVSKDEDSFFCLRFYLHFNDAAPPFVKLKRAAYFVINGLFRHFSKLFLKSKVILPITLQNEKRQSLNFVNAFLLSCPQSHFKQYGIEACKFIQFGL